MIEALLSFLQMKAERCIGDSFEFGEPEFGKIPEVFNSADMRASSRECILRMINSKVHISKIDVSIVAAPTVRIHNG